MINENIMNKSLYIDTSVFDGYFEKGFLDGTKPFFDKVINDKITIIISELVVDELKNAPDNIKAFYDSMPNEILKIVNITDEIKTLANKYIEANILTEKHIRDCLHVATATIYNADSFVSQNFKNIVNYGQINGYNSVNTKEGYKTISICSPNSISCCDPPPGIVKRMREIRDELGEKLMHMTWEEQKAFFQEGKDQWNAERKQTAKEEVAV
jgi:predicted nucleic acid-binding protein